MTTEAIMEQALRQAEKLQTSVKKYEYARASCEILDEDDTEVVIQVISKTASDKYQLFPLPEGKMNKIINTIRAMYESEIEEAQKEVQSVIKSHEDVIESRESVIKSPEYVIKQEDGTDKVIDCHTLAAAVNRKNEEAKPKKNFINEDFEAAVDKMIAESKKDNAPEKEQKPEVAPVQQKRVFTKDIISDKDLKKYYFKDGMTIKEIAVLVGVNESALYKRIEAMKKQQADNAKECASS